MQARLEELAAERRHLSFRRLAVLLRRDGVVVNIKRVLRIYRAAHLEVRKQIRRRVALGVESGRTSPRSEHEGLSRQSFDASVLPVAGVLRSRKYPRRTRDQRVANSAILGEFGAT